VVPGEDDKVLHAQRMTGSMNEPDPGLAMAVP